MRSNRLVLALAFFFIALPAVAQIRPDNLQYQPLHFTPKKPNIQRLGNGITLYLLEDHEVPLVQGFAYARGGSIWEPAGKAGLAEMAGEVMRTGGAGNKTGDELDSRLEFLAASIEAGYDDEFGSANFSCLSENIPEIMGDFANILRAPRFESDKIEVARAQLLDGVRRRWDYPTTVGNAVFLELLYGADSPYARFSTTASIKAITRQDLIDFHRTCWQPSNISLAIYGDFQTKEMIGLLDRTLGGWKSDVHLQPAPPAVTTEPRGGTYFIEKKGLQQATIILGHLGPARHGPDHYALIPMNYILGTGGFNSRLMRELRSNRGLTYGVDGGVSEGIIRGILDVEMTTSNENAALAVETARKLLADFGAGTIAPEERQVAFNYLENSFVFKFNSTGQVLSQTIVKKLQGYPETYWATYPDKIRGVTDDQMLAAARRYIHPDQLVVLIVGDKEKLAEQLKKLGRCTELPFPKT